MQQVTIGRHLFEEHALARLIDDSRGLTLQHLHARFQYALGALILGRVQRLIAGEVDGDWRLGRAERLLVDLRADPVAYRRDPARS